ncbi:MAG: FAD-binding oxidoreductase [Pseudomonadota bacterium]
MLSDADATFETRLRAALPGATFRDAEARYFEEPRGRYAGSAGLVLAPASVEDVSIILREANAARVPVIPYGGGTGLVGGQVAEGLPAPVVLTLERMTKIREIHADENVLVAEAGAILKDVQEAASGVGRLFPLSLASEGSARIGGLLATNAGGTGVLRYGNARDLCLGLEVVRADGTIWHGLSRLRKDNAGFDLRNLMIGSEGTLGIITAASLKLFPVAAEQGTAIFTLPSAEAALKLLAMTRAQVGEGVSAFELIHRQGFDFLAETLPEIRQPFDTPPEWCALIELGLPKGLSAPQAFETLFESALKAGLTEDAVIAQSELQRQEIWAVREHIPEANRRIGSVSSHDISMPLSEIPAFIPEATDALGKIGQFRINCFGHVGDGNLHYNVFPMPGKSRADHENQRAEIKRTVHDLVHAHGGSVAAEHGVGRLKVEDLERYGDPALLEMMRAVKAALDPNGILNPGVMLR